MHIYILTILALIVIAMTSPHARAECEKCKKRALTDDVVVGAYTQEDTSGYWTTERMLLAVPMPMTSEERDFLASHLPLDDIRNWSFDEFHNYIASPYGRSNVINEAFRWQDIVHSLERQNKIARELLKVNTITGQPSTDPIYEMHAPEQVDALLATNSEIVYTSMKLSRQKIADLATEFDRLREEATLKGLGSRLDELLEQN